MYLSIPSKKTYEVDITKPLNGYISRAFKDYKSSDYQPAVNDFNKLRSSLVPKTSDKTESSLELFSRYYDQLIAIEAKFPLVESEVRVPFKWQSAFDRDTLFAGKKSLTISNGKYEKACILYTIAAMQCQIAESKDHKSDEGLKASAKLFMTSSTIFKHLHENIASLMGTATPTIDLHPESLATFSALMLAQAQDCFCRKAMNDNMKPDIIAKLCIQCSDFYADTMQVMQQDSVRNLWPKEWLPSITSKQACFHALAEMYDALRCQNAKDFGIEISRLQHASELIAAGESRAGSAANFLFSAERLRIGQRLTAARKDNDFIYHARIPDVVSLPSVDKLAVAKRNPDLFSGQLSKSFKDLFVKMLPLSIHNALMDYDAKRQAMVASSVCRLKEATNIFDCILASLNLPASLEDFEGGSSLPSSLLEKAAYVRSRGGLKKLQDLVQDLPDKIKRNREILVECSKMLKDEENTDNNLRSKFNEAWTRTKSAPLAAPLKLEIKKYDSLIEQAASSDKLIRQRFAEYEAGFRLLSKSDEEITAALPSASPMSRLADSPVVNVLRSMMSEVVDLKKDRNVLIGEIQAVKKDISQQLLKSLAEDGAITLDIAEELTSSYGPYNEAVEQTLSSQAQLIINIQKSNDEFTSQKIGDKSVENRETKLIQLAEAYDSYIQIMANLAEGSKFYADMTELLLSLQSKISDFCFARKTEKEDLMKDVQQQIANKPTARATPQVPAYQYTSGPPIQATVPQGPPPAQGPGQVPVTYNPYGAPYQPYAQPPPQQVPTYQTPYPPQSYPGYPPQPTNPFQPPTNYPQQPPHNPNYPPQQPPR